MDAKLLQVFSRFQYLNGISAEDFVKGRSGYKSNFHLLFITIKSGKRLLLVEDIVLNLGALNLQTCFTFSGIVFFLL